MISFQKIMKTRGKTQTDQTESLYNQVLKWKFDMIDTRGKHCIVNFLIFYYTRKQINKPFTSNQCDHIRYWANFDTNNIEWDLYNIKFDLLFSIAMLQQSIPHLKVFYKWVSDETPKQPPSINDSNNTGNITNSFSNIPKKNNYLLTRYQSACILGDWNNVQAIGKMIQKLKNDYFITYNFRSLELPTKNPNYGLIYNMVPIISQKFERNMSVPPMFDTWSIPSFKYKPINCGNITSKEVSQYVYANDKIMDNNGFYVFYPTQNMLMTRQPNVIKIWGKICQFISPLSGSTSFSLLPMTGTWNDTLLYMQVTLIQYYII